MIVGASDAVTLPTFLLLLAALWTQERETLPPLSDLQRFPPLWLVKHNIAFGEAYLVWLGNRHALELPNRKAIEQEMILVRRCLEPWVILAGAIEGHDEWQGFTEHHDEQGKRKRLIELRNLIGAAAYYSGEMPLPVPVWRFRRGDGAGGVASPLAPAPCKRQGSTP